MKNFDNRRSRNYGRNNNNNSNNNKKKGAKRCFESRGPGNTRVKGTAAQLYEKYMSSARAYSVNHMDSVLVENFLQHAEHYYRMMQFEQERGSGDKGKIDDIVCVADMDSRLMTAQGTVLFEENSDFSEDAEAVSGSTASVSMVSEQRGEEPPVLHEEKTPKRSRNFKRNTLKNNGHSAKEEIVMSEGVITEVVEGEAISVL